jgi:hypothetical protein
MGWGWYDVKHASLVVFINSLYLTEREVHFSEAYADGHCVTPATEATLRNSLRALLWSRLQICTGIIVSSQVLS